VRAVVGGEVVADTRNGKLLHETGLLPQLYFPLADLRDGLLVPSDHTTHCPFKGDATYRSIRVRVLLDGRPIAETDRPMLLTETGLPNRYIPPQDVRRDVLTRSTTHTV
jgi:uncharacterized protein (DUF427 family)